MQSMFSSSSDIRPTLLLSKNSTKCRSGERLTLLCLKKRFSKMSRIRPTSRPSTA